MTDGRKRRRECYRCDHVNYTSNTEWFKCEACGERVWINFENPHAPSKKAVRTQRKFGGWGS